jgi:hypothetical protein
LSQLKGNVLTPYIININYLYGSPPAHNTKLLLSPEVKGVTLCNKNDGKTTTAPFARGTGNEEFPGCNSKSPPT